MYDMFRTKLYEENRIQNFSTIIFVLNLILEKIETYNILKNLKTDCGTNITQ